MGLAAVVGDGVAAPHDVVALDVGRHPFLGLAAVVGQQFLDAAAGVTHLLHSDGHVGGLSLGPAVGLVDHDAGVTTGSAATPATASFPDRCDRCPSVWPTGNATGRGASPSCGRASTIARRQPKTAGGASLDVAPVAQPG